MTYKEMTFRLFDELSGIYVKMLQDTLIYAEDTSEYPVNMYNGWKSL